LTLFTLFRLALAIAGYSYCCDAPPAETHAVARPAACPVAMPCQSPACYVVAVRQTGEGPNTITWPKVLLAEKGQCLVAASTEDGKGRRVAWGMHVRHRGTEDDVARFMLTLKGGTHTSCTEMKVPIGKDAKEVNVALGTDSPEPLCLGVRVERKPAPFSVACTMPAPMPLALPTSSALPAPMPVPQLAYVPPVACPPNTGWHGTYPYTVVPVTPWTYPTQPMTPPYMPSPVTPVAFVPPMTTKTVRLAKEDGRSKVVMHGPAGMSKAVRMTVEDGPCGKLHLAAGAKHVHVSGDGWKAQADEVVMCGDGCVKLAGHVKLSCDKLGDGVSLTADKVSIRVTGGKFMQLLPK